MKRFLFIVSSVLYTFFLQAQTNKEIVSELVAKTNAKVSIEAETDLLQFIRFPKDQPLRLKGTNLEQKVDDFLKDYKGLFINGNDEKQILQLKKRIEDPVVGNKHLVYESFYLGVPVFGNDLRFHFNALGELTTINGLVTSVSELNVLPVFNEGEAAAIAIELVAKEHQEELHTPVFAKNTRLCVYRDKIFQNVQGRDYLMYEVEVRNDENVRDFIYIDAHSGKIIEQISALHHAMSRRLYENNTGNQIWQEGDVFPGTLDIWQRNELEAAAHMYYFFEHAFGFTSYDDADAEMLTINNNPNIACPNATWNGVSANYCTGTASDDVVAHEWGHAYTEYNANLIYQWQTGALNESYSDIWGETVDLLNGYEDAGEDLSLRTDCNNSLRWKMGEDATSLGIIRDMWDPNCNGHPGKVTDGVYFCGTGDFGGVHINSGVNNHAYALLVDGGTYNGQTINSLGFTKSAHIFWRALNIYLTNTSDFVNQADALEAACADLVGINLEGLSFTAVPAGLSGEIITVADCQEVSEAVAAVELRTLPTACGFTTILAQPAQNLCDASSGADPIFEDDFESGIAAWTITQLPVNPADWDPREWIIDSSLPVGRSGSAAFGPDPIPVGNCSTDFDNGIIRMESPVITIPSGVTTTIKLKFDHYVAMETNWDGGNIKYSLNGGTWTIIPSAAFLENPYNSTLNTAGAGNDNPMENEIAFTGADGGSVTSSWGQTMIDLSSLGLAANDNIQLRFELGVDGCNGNDGWYIDDLMVFNCVVGLPVELLSFNALANKNDVVLDWSTASELNTAVFEIERSKDGRNNWETIGNVDAAGDSNIKLEYQFTDKEPKIGKNFYRLKQLDKDGSFTYTHVEEVHFGLNKTEPLIITPNPFKNAISVVIPNVKNETVLVELFDSSGKKILNTNIDAQINEPIVVENLASIPRGVYWLKVTSSSGIFTSKILK